MAIYEPRKPELGKNATGRRIAALRTLNEAQVAQFKRYTGGGGGDAAHVSYRVVAPDGTVRELATKDVPAYVIGHEDGYRGFRAHVHDALQAALVDPDVNDQESLLNAVLETLDRRCGDPIHEAAAHFAPQDDGSDDSGVHAIA